MNEMRELVEKLNYYRDAYYNNNEMLISDQEYDELFDKLQELEDSSGIILATSPTQTVGYTVQSKLNKVTHDHPMLSLNKTKDVDDLVDFAGNHVVIFSLKLDGLTCSLHYNSDGYLDKAETRGNGIIGEDVLENVKQIPNIPIHINNDGRELTVDGEVIVDYETFNRVNENLATKFSHPRNYASGSLRQLNTSITKERNLKFIAWKLVSGAYDGLDKFNERFLLLQNLGFEIVPFKTAVADIDYKAYLKSEFTEIIDELKSRASVLNYPIDGIVVSYNYIPYGESLGNTAHHPLHSIAFKFYNEAYETILRDIEWNPTRTGILAPVAVFDPVDLDGAMTTRASLSNVSIIKELELGIGDTITVSRRNEVIPHIEDNMTRSNTYVIPTTCACCGGKTEIHKDNNTEVLYCTNDGCVARSIAKFVHYVSREGMNIDGLSEATIEKFIANGFLHDFIDIYYLSSFKDEICMLDGFGEKSYYKLMEAISNSRTVKFENFLVALGIPQIGKSAAKEIAKKFNTCDALFTAIKSGFDFSQLKDFGATTNSAIYKFFTEDKMMELNRLVTLLTFVEPEVCEANTFINGKTFVITGAFSKPRKEYEELITKNGGKLSNSVSKKTDYLLTNDKESGSSKNLKAQELGIPILSEAEFIASMED